jgi:hypothetical protein
MTDRIIHSAWWLAVMAMIFSAAAVAMFSACNGVLDLIGQHFSAAVPKLVLACVAAVTALQICRYRNDLM